MTSPKERTAVLSAVSIFSETPRESLGLIAPLLEEITVAVGETVIERGEMGDAMYIIKNGRMIVHDGERELNHLGPGDVFGEMAVLDPEPRSASVTAQEESVLLVLRRDALHNLMMQQPKIARGVIRILSDRLRRMVYDMSVEFAYMQQFARLTAAAVAIESEIYIPESLDDVAARSDELGQLGRVFQQTIRELARRDQQLREQVARLQIEINEVKKSRQVAELTETTYFRNLQQQAQRLRRRRKPKARARAADAQPQPAPQDPAHAPALPTQPDLARARHYVANRLSTELGPQYSYHSLFHTMDEVAPAAGRFAALSGIEGEDLLLLMTAAYFHDIGFVVNRANHEVIGADIARTVLPGMGYQPEQIDAICGMIMATRLPQSPRTLLEKILADADLDSLGRDDFLERNAALRAELAAFGSTPNDYEWHLSQLQFVRHHDYQTPAAVALRQAGKEANIAALERLVEAAQPPSLSQLTEPQKSHD
jgi:uncharacterized protein